MILLLLMIMIMMKKKMMMLMVMVLLLLLLVFLLISSYFSCCKYCKELSEVLLLAVISLNTVLLSWSGVDGKIEKKRVRLMRMLRLQWNAVPKILSSEQILVYGAQITGAIIGARTGDEDTEMSVKRW